MSCPVHSGADLGIAHSFVFIRVGLFGSDESFSVLDDLPRQLDEKIAQIAIRSVIWHSRRFGSCVN